MKKASDIIRALFDADTTENARMFSSLFSAWEKIAGEDISAHSKIIDLKNGALQIEVDHPGWLQMIRLKERSILRALKSNYKALDIRTIRLIIDSGEYKNIPEPVQRQPVAEEVADENSEEYRAFKALLERVRTLGTQRDRQA